MSWVFPFDLPPRQKQFILGPDKLIGRTNGSTFFISWFSNSHRRSWPSSEELYKLLIWLASYNKPVMADSCEETCSTASSSRLVSHRHVVPDSLPQTWWWRRRRRNKTNNQRNKDIRINCHQMWMTEKHNITLFTYHKLRGGRVSSHFGDWTRAGHW